MVELTQPSSERIPVSHLERAMLDVGLSPDTVDQVINELMTKPQDLITLEEAARLFEIPYGTLGRWVHKGHLEVKERRTYPAPGGGKVLVDKRDVEYLKLNPPKRGRPKKEVSKKIIRNST